MTTQQLSKLFSGKWPLMGNNNYINNIEDYTQHTFPSHHLPGATVQTRIPNCARSLAIGIVIPTIPPLLAE